MRKLIIHLGYPKTATTTIQDVILKKLHEREQINFLGKSQLMSQSESMVASDEIIQSLSSECSPFPTGKLKLSDDKVNVISNEHFLQAFNKNQTISLQNPISIANRLHHYLTTHYDDIKVHIVVTLRNQCSLIHSLFTEVYNLYFRNDASLNTIEKYLATGLKTGKNGLFSIYYYADILDTYSQLFGKDNITILFFEDINHDSQKFFQPLAHLLEVDDSFIVDEFIQNKNTKIKTKNGYKTSEFTLSILISSLLDNPIINKFTKKIRDNTFIKKTYHMTLKKIADKIKLSGGKNIHFLTAENKERIIDTFQLTNEKLCRNFSIPKEKLIRYGYLKEFNSR